MTYDNAMELGLVEVAIHRLMEVIAHDNLDDDTTTKYSLALGLVIQRRDDILKDN